jgi:hypothetical protein
LISSRFSEANCLNRTLIWILDLDHQHGLGQQIKVEGFPVDHRDTCPSTLSSPCAIQVAKNGARTKMPPQWIGANVVKFNEREKAPHHSGAFSLLGHAARRTWSVRIPARARPNRVAKFGRTVVGGRVCICIRGTHVVAGGSLVHGAACIGTWRTTRARRSAGGARRTASSSAAAGTAPRAAAAALCKCE